MTGWQPQGYDPTYQQPQYPPQPPPRKPRRGLAAIGCLGVAGFVVLIAGLAGAHSSSSSAPAVAPLQTLATLPMPAASAAPAQPTAAQTVTYEVSGSPADVTYGPAGSNLSGSVPLNVTQPLASPIYYAVTAQLQGSGAVSCQILVDGKVISQSTATGGYNIADCEISKGFSGQWRSTMG